MRQELTSAARSQLSRWAVKWARENAARAMRKVHNLWEHTPSGIAIPAGTVTDLRDRSSTTYVHVKARAQEIEALFTSAGIKLPRGCDLAGLIATAKSLSDHWLTSRTDQLSISALFRVLHLERVAAAVLPLRNVPDRAKYLEALTSGSLNLLNRRKSRAKNTLWELEVWSMLRGKSFVVSLVDPPDIVVELAGGRIGLACKKLYSEKHVQNVLSQAVRQVENDFDVGIVAMNIDDLVPADSIASAPNERQMGNFILRLNERFLRQHERHFRKYLSSGRLISAAISTSVVADIYRERVRFNNYRQWTVWTIPGLSAEKQSRLRAFYEQLMR